MAGVSELRHGQGYVHPIYVNPEAGGDDKADSKRDAGRPGWVVGRTHTHSPLVLASSYLPVLSPGDDFSFPFNFQLLYRTGP